jgi:hypothetical protein
VLPDGRLLGARAVGGVAIRNHDYLGNTRTQRVLVRTYLADKIYTNLYSQIGKPYDWRGVVAFGLGDRDWRDNSAWFCSELQVWATEAAGFFKRPLNIPFDRLSPRDQWLLFSPFYDLIV